MDKLDNLISALKEVKEDLEKGMEIRQIQPSMPGGADDQSPKKTKKPKKKEAPTLHPKPVEIKKSGDDKQLSFNTPGISDYQHPVHPETGVPLAPPSGADRTMWNDKFNDHGSSEWEAMHQMSPEQAAEWKHHHSFASQRPSDGLALHRMMTRKSEEILKFNKGSQWSLEKTSPQSKKAKRVEATKTAWNTYLRNPSVSDTREGDALYTAKDKAHEAYQDEIDHAKATQAQAKERQHWRKAKNKPIGEMKRELFGNKANKSIEEDDSLSKGGPANPHMGSSVFSMDHVNKVAGMKDHAEAKAYAHSILAASTANKKNKVKIGMMIDSSKSPSHLVHGMSNHILAHDSEGLKVIR